MSPDYSLEKSEKSRIYDLRTLYHIKFEYRLTYTTHLIQAQLALIGIIRSIFFPLKSEVSVKTNLVLFHIFFRTTTCFPGIVFLREL